ncbi:unnamed protein product [Rangifer tarandus platyrhynchus]|uniref:Uncharacterized protein n=1 Tax=Rangifer tarandus platyrhynchus TaxID=3082113 RepID=A0ABN8ZG91_RANTA|nr:unnamed protein product [Rangifer tarandus platyrhynchus]
MAVVRLRGPPGAGVAALGSGEGAGFKRVGNDCCLSSMSEPLVSGPPHGETERTWLPHTLEGDDRDPAPKSAGRSLRQRVQNLPGSR